MIEVFESIKTRVLAEVSEIRNVELWNNQVEKEEGGQSQMNVYPSVFLGVDGGIAYSARQDQGSGSAQEGTFILSVHIVQQDIIGNIHNDRHTDWSILELKQKVYKALHGFKPEGCNVEMFRVAEEMSDNHSKLYEYIQDYSCRWVDNDLIDEGTLVEVDLEVEVFPVIESPLVYRTSRNFDAPTEFQSDLETDLDAEI